MKFWYSFIAIIVLSAAALFVVGSTAIDKSQDTHNYTSFNIAQKHLGIFSNQKERIESWGDKIEENKEEKESNLELELSTNHSSESSFSTQNTSYFSQKYATIPRSFFERMKSWNTPLYLQFACLKINC